MSARADAAREPRRYVRARFYLPDFRQLQQEAAARRISVTACVADCLSEYFALRVEMASAVSAPGKPGDPHSGLIHSLLARTEERLAATLDARATELSEALRLQRTMLDRLVQLYLVHTPEVPPDRHQVAMASANRRYAGYQAAVRDRIVADRDRDQSPT